MEKKKLTIRERRAIYRKYVEGGASVRALAFDYKVPAATIYNIVGGRVKKTKTPRSDKGEERPGYGMKLDPEQKTALKSTDADPDDIITMLECQAFKLLSDVETIGAIATRAKILEAVGRILKQVATHKLESHIKRADATMFALIIRRYEPNATDEQIIKIWRETAEELRTTT